MLYVAQKVQKSDVKIHINPIDMTNVCWTSPQRAILNGDFLDVEKWCSRRHISEISLNFSTHEGNPYCCLFQCSDCLCCTRKHIIIPNPIADDADNTEYITGILIYYYAGFLSLHRRNHSLSCLHRRRSLLGHAGPRQQIRLLQ